MSNPDDSPTREIDFVEIQSKLASAENDVRREGAVQAFTKYSPFLQRRIERMRSRPQKGTPMMPGAMTPTDLLPIIYIKFVQTAERRPMEFADRTTNDGTFIPGEQRLKSYLNSMIQSQELDSIRRAAGRKRHDEEGTDSKTLGATKRANPNAAVSIEMLSGWITDDNPETASLIEYRANIDATLASIRRLLSADEYQTLTWVLEEGRSWPAAAKEFLNRQGVLKPTEGQLQREADRLRIALSRKLKVVRDSFEMPSR